MSDSITLSIKGMKCQGCLNAVKNALGAVDGVDRAKIDLEQGRAEIVLKERAAVTAEKLVETVRDAGYEASL